MKTISLTCLALLSTALMSAPALAGGCTPTSGTVCANKSCDSFGVSQLDGDGKNVLVCLKNDSGALIWKATTSNGQNCNVYVQTPPFLVNIYPPYSMTIADRQIFSVAVLTWWSGYYPSNSSTNTITYSEGGSDCGGGGQALYQCLNGTITTVGNFFSSTACTSSGS